VSTGQALRTPTLLVVPGLTAAADRASSRLPNGWLTTFNIHADRLPSLTQGGGKCEGPVEIGFVLQPGNSRQTHATLYFVVFYIIDILALFGHFSTLSDPPVRRLGFRPCRSCRV
jgi:hypothetical protein